MISIVLIGLSLSLDAFAVSVSSGISIPDLRPFHAVRGALFFGLFQFLMPVAGWYLGNTFAAAIGTWDHWLAFGLLAFIGGKMLWEARPKGGALRGGGSPPVEGGSGRPAQRGWSEGGTRNERSEFRADFPPHESVGELAADEAGSERASPRDSDIRGLGTLTILALATSIDALAVGLSFSILGQGIWVPAALIGAITTAVCLTGFEFGRRIGMIFERGAQIAGGLILVGIGVKILAEHLAG